MHRKIRAWCAGILAVGMMLQLCPMQSVKAEETGTTYYVNQDGGNDNNAGTSESEAWSSLDKINSTTFQPGDKILFERGDVWTGQLSPKGSGEKGSPIVIGAYGTGEERPRIDGNNWCEDEGDDLENRIFNAAVYFYNQEYWEITSLEVTNRIPGENPDDHIKKYGVLIMGEDAGTLNHMYCLDLNVHDIVSHPIGQQAGIGRGGIIYIIRGNEVPTRWDDILIEGNQVGPNINHYGINLLSTWGSNQFEHETGIPDSEYANQRVNSTNIVIRNNYCQEVGNAAICPSAYSNALIESNVCDGCNSGPNGNVPIWWENGDNTVAQFNEVFGSGASESKEDSQAFDADGAAKLNYIQYNYTHDNPSGAFFECALGTKFTTHIRYNICQNDGYGTNSYGGGAFVTLGGWSTSDSNKMYVYNNDFYLGEGYDSYITNNWDGEDVNPDTYQFRNNVIYSDGESKGWHEYFKGSVDYNAYGGSDTAILREDDVHAVTITKDDFKAIGTGSKGLDSVDGYQLAENSKCLNAGTLIPGNGGRDYWGNSVSMTEVPNIGADNSGATAAEENYGIDFEDREANEAALTGTYEDCVFGEGWLTAEVKDSKVLYADGTKTVYNITLPENKTIESFQAFCDGTASVKLSGNGYERGFGITSIKNTFETNFPSAMKEVKIEIQSPAGSDAVKFDNIVLGDAEYMRNNLALKKPAYTDGYDEHPASNGNDGDEDTMWVHAGDDFGVTWFVDLEENYDLSDFELVFENEETEGAWKYQILGARDGDAYFENIPLYDATENTDGSKVQKGNFEPGSIYRYVLVEITGFPGYDYWPGFAEFRVFEREKTELDKSDLLNLISKVKYMKQGNYTDESYANLQSALKTAKDDYLSVTTPEEVKAAVVKLQTAIDALEEKEETEDSNIALNKPVTTSAPSYWEFYETNANDGDLDTMWVVDGDSVESLLPQWWQVDLRKEYVLNRYKLVFEDDGEDGAWQYRIEGSQDGEIFETLVEKTDSPSGTRVIEEAVTDKEAYRYVRVTLLAFPEWDGADYWPAFMEFELYGKAKVSVDYSRLAAKLEGAKAIEADEFTEESYADLQKAIAEAEAVLNNAEATQQMVDEQIAKLETAIQALEEAKEPADTSLLEAALTEAKALDADMYTEDTYKELVAEIEKTEALLEKENLEQEDVDAQTKALKEAMDNLEAVEGAEPDYLELEAKVKSAKELNAEAYTEESYAGLQAAIEEAETVLNNAEATQEMINEQIVKLEVAIQALEEAETPINKSLLEAALTEAKELKGDAYTEESYKVLVTEIEKAEVLLEKENLTQDEIDAQTTALKAAIEALEKKSGVVDPGDKPDPNPDDKPEIKPTPKPDLDKPVTKPGANKSEPNKSGSTVIQSAKTGDTANVGIYVALMGIGALAMILFGRRKRG